MLLNNQWINNQIKTEIKQYRETKDDNDSIPQNLWDAVKAVLRKVYCNTGLPQERRMPYEQSKLTINETKKGRINEAQSQ